MSLNFVIDEDGFLWCDGCLKYVEYLLYDVWYFVIFFRNNCVIIFIIKYYYEKGKYVIGINYIFFMILLWFWIIFVWEEIWKWEW